MTASLLVVAVAAVLSVLVQDVTASTHYYVIGTSTNWDPNSTLAGATTLCVNTVQAYVSSATSSNVFPLLAGASGVTSWSDSHNVYSLKTGQLIGTGANFRGFDGIGLTMPLNDVSYQVCTGLVWTGLNANFASSANTCSSWSSTSTSFRGMRGDCSSPGTNWMTDGGLSAPGVGCQINVNSILCIYNGATLAPSRSPSRQPSIAPVASKPTTSPGTRKPSITPSKSPSRQPRIAPSIAPSITPSITPSTSKPTSSPRSSKPSVSPVTSKPSNEPRRTTKGPGTGIPTFNPVMVNPSNPDSAFIGISIGAGAGGAAMFMVIIGIILIALRRICNVQQASFAVTNGK